ncbi:hypothetical protein [Polynucleobacter sp. KF022]|uniref:hypothetical protein n=1 Tax=Polynucleobacter sp. KF022 TaxID=2982615 RepID=UPI0024919099|nr:hypothetical protein [Polynucleobacter sp. KF022]
MLLLNPIKLKNLRINISLLGLLIPIFSLALPAFFLNIAFLISGLIYILRRGLFSCIAYLFFGISTLISAYSSRKIYATNGDDFIRYYENYELCSNTLSACMQNKGSEYILYFLYWMLPESLQPIQLLFINSTIIGLATYYIFISRINENKTTLNLLFILFNIFLVSGAFFWATQFTRAALACLFLCYFLANKKIILFSLALFTHSTTLLAFIIALSVKYRAIFFGSLSALIIIYLDNQILYKSIDLIPQFLEELESKTIFLKLNINGDNIDLSKDILSSFPVYLLGYWYSRSGLFAHAWILMAASHTFLFSFPLLAVRLYLIIFFSGPMLIASIIDFKKIKLASNQNYIMIFLLVQIYVMLVMLYRFYYRYLMSLDSDFGLFSTYSPFLPLIYKF